MRLGQYLGYGAGDAANNLTFMMVSAFLLIYYTNVAGISAATAGTLFLVVRIWGGFTDLFAGRRVDETQTRWGKFRPYVLFGSVPLLVLLVALFSIPGGLGPGGKLLWAYASYALFQLAYSFVNIPYGSLSAAMTQVPDERAKLSTSRSIADAEHAVAHDRDRRHRSRGHGEPDGRGGGDHPGHEVGALLAGRLDGLGDERRGEDHAGGRHDGQHDVEAGVAEHVAGVNTPPRSAARTTR